METWKEQRTWGFDAPLAALKDHPLKEQIESELALLSPSIPPLDEFEKLESVENLEFGEFIVSVSERTGALIRLFDSVTEREWCDAQHSIGSLQYSVYNSSDYDAWERSSEVTRSFMKEYFIDWNEWGPQDFGKPNLEKVHSLSTSVPIFFLVYSKPKVSSRYKESYLRMQGNETTLVVVMEFDKLYHSLYGAPESIYAIYRTSNESHSISFETIVLISSLSLIQSYSIRPQHAFPSRSSLYST